MYSYMLLIPLGTYMIPISQPVKRDKTMKIPKLYYSMVQYPVSTLPVQNPN